MTTFADKIIKFNRDLNFKGRLPRGIRVMNPFRDNPDINSITEIFYRKFYDDNKKRKIILGINPGRFGAGVTGIPFTDTKRLSEICKIKIDSFSTHELSSVFIYDMIDKYGGAKKFYEDYYINSVCPLGFVELNPKGNWINLNYYDNEDLFKAVKQFIYRSIEKQIDFGIDTDVCYILGSKNAEVFKKINDEKKYFGSVVSMHHPRYISQYKLKSKDKFISDYLHKLRA